MWNTFRSSRDAAVNPALIEDLANWEPAAPASGSSVQGGAAASPASDAGPEDGGRESEAVDGAAPEGGSEDIDDADDAGDPLDPVIVSSRDEDDLDDNLKQHPAVRKILKDKRRLERRLGNAIKKTGALRGLDVDVVLDHARRYQDLSSKLAENPRLRALVTGTDPGDSAARATQPTTRFDLAKLPFDRNENAVNALFAQLLEAVNDLDSRVTRDLMPRFQGVERSITASQVERVENQWKATTAAALAELPREFQDTFEFAMHTAFRAAKAEGRLGQVDPRRIVDAILKQHRVGKGTAQRATAAAQQRTATQNATMPRRPAGGGTPAPANQGGRGETVKQFNRALRTQFG